MIQSISPKVLEKLRRLDTPTVCNLVELFDVRPRHTGFMDATIQACFPELPPLVGYAATATFRASAPPRRGDAYASLDLQVARFGELAGPPVVVFQDLDSPVVAATFGEVMCTVYQAFGAQGLITSGAGRDLDQVHALHFPVFTGGTIAAHGYTHIPDLHLPVHVGGMAVYPNDLIHADRNGVTTIPPDIADELADLGAEYTTAEKVVIDGVKAGMRPEELAALRAESSRQIEALRARVSRAQR